MTDEQVDARFDNRFNGMVRPLGMPPPAWASSQREPDTHQGRRTDESWREDERVYRACEAPATRPEMRIATGYTKNQTERALQRLRRAKRMQPVGSRDGMTLFARVAR